MKKLLITLFGLIGIAYAQCADEDTVRSIVVNNITATTARINGSVSHYAATATANVLIYVRVGHTDTLTSTVVGSSPLRNLTGLYSGVQYVFYYVTVCGSGTMANVGRYYFTTAANTVSYTPLGNTKVPYFKIDSNLLVLCGDTTIGRAPNVMGQIKMRCADSLFYYYNGRRWQTLSIDSLGIIAKLNDKVDSVTVVGALLYYWKQGVGYGHGLPTGIDTAFVLQQISDSLAAARVTITNADNIGDTLLTDIAPDTIGIKTLTAGYGIINTPGATTITQKVDTATIFPAVRATISGGVNTPIGSAYKIAVNTNAASIKSLRPGYGINLDSATTTGEIKIIYDTVTTFPLLIRKKDSATLLNPTGYLMGKDIVGDWSSTVFGSSLSGTGFTTYAVTPTFSGGMVLAGNTGTICSGFVYRNVEYTASQNYTQTVDFTMNTKPTSPADYLYIGKRSANTSQQTQNAIAVRMTSSTTCKIVPYILYGCSATAVDSSEALPMANGNKYRIYVAASTSNLYCKLTLLKTNGQDSLTVAVNYKYLPNAGSFLQPANTGADWVGATGSTGNYTVTQYVTKHYDYKKANILFVGNSIGTRYDATSVKNHYSFMSMVNSDKSWANFSGGGDRLIELNLRVQEMINLAPQYCIIEAGVNDDAADIRSGLTTLIDTLQAHNIIPVFLKLFSGASKDTVAYNVCREQGVQLVDANRPNQPLPTSDGLHPTDLGMQQITYILKSECPAIFGTTGGSELYTLNGLGDYKVTSLTNGQVPVWNSTNNRYENGLPVAGAAGSNHQITFNNSGTSDGGTNTYLDAATGHIGFATVPQVAFDAAGTFFSRSNENPTSGTGLGMSYYTGGGYGIIRAYDWTGGAYKDLAIGKNDNQLWLASTGNVGIGNQTASEALHVTGNVRFSGALMPNNAAGTSGNFLQSAGAGSPPVWTSTVAATSVPLSGITTSLGNNTVNGGGYNFSINNTGSNGITLNGGTVGSSPYSQLNVAPTSSTIFSQTAGGVNAISFTTSVGSSGYGVNKKSAVVMGIDNAYWITLDSNHAKVKADTVSITSLKGVGIGITPTADLHIKAGTATAGGAPFKLTTGTSLTSPEAGALEYTTPQLFFTNGDGLRQELPQIQQTRVTSNFTKTSDITVTDITGLTANIAAGKTYRFEAKLYTTSNVAGGVSFAIGGTATATAIIYEGLTTDAGLITQGRGTTLNAAVGSVTAVTAAYTVITGTITCNAAGTLTVTFGQNASSGSASTVLVGSTFVVTQIL